MKSNTFFMGLIFSAALAAIACSDDTADTSSTDTPNSDVENNDQGSCSGVDFEGDNYCYEVEETDATFKSTCEFMGFQWSASHCDENLYARKCVEEFEVSNDGEQTWHTEHYVYYYVEESTTVCLGEETEL